MPNAEGTTFTVCGMWAVRDGPMAVLRTFVASAFGVSGIHNLSVLDGEPHGNKPIFTSNGHQIFYSSKHPVEQPGHLSGAYCEVYP